MIHMNKTGKKAYLSNEAVTALTEWYKQAKRDLPWRDTGDPYDVWLSEIMLQQTRVEAVKERFIQFRNELPDIASLAECDDERLMRLWEGMGYYSRARNLKKCAQVLVQDYDGKLPEDPELLKKLPGIGPYTAGAISSIAYSRAVPAVDGNVLRVMTRLYGMEDDIRNEQTKRKIEDIIAAYFDSAPLPCRVSDFTQAWMELGALVCMPNGAPACNECPLSEMCRAHLDNRTDEIPCRSPLKQRKVIRKTILVIRDGSHFLLHKRPDTGLLAGLYEFPSIDRFLTRDEALEEVRKLGFDPLRIHVLPDAKHIFTHLEWHMHAFEIMTAGSLSCPENCILADKRDLAGRAIPNTFQVYKDYYSLRD